VIELARKVSTTDASVFISGESGTGKEQIAQFIHHNSRRSSRSLVAVNCAALPEPLLESEMFGHLKGAFTGAVRDKPGLLETANGGTLFLDELTEMPMTIQAKLLRVVQDGMVRRVGSNTTDAVVNVRFIAATNRDPQQATDEGALRKDLYYRLRVVPIHIPPLRERPEDIPVLAQRFLSVYWKRHRDMKETLPRFSQSALRSLQERPWRGNVRELQNVIEHAVVLLASGSEIQPDDLPSIDEAPAQAVPQTSFAVYGDDEAYHNARERIVAQFERSYLMWLVSRASGNMSRAARIAGVDRTTLYRLMEKHELHRDTIITAR
jgi:transcriptional regulator with PAS, ATPase and Fis domain